jgi:hypothetical protein
MDKDNDLELIIDYINGELSNEEKRKFEERLSHELELVESFKIQKEIQHAFLRMQIREQVQSIRVDAQILEQTAQNKVSGYAKYSEAAHSSATIENVSKVQRDKHILRKIAAVFISIIFIGSLWIWFNYNPGNPSTIVNTIPPVKNDSTYSPPINNQQIEKNNSIPKLTEESYLKRIDVVQLNPDLSFGFGQKKDVLGNIYSKRIILSSKGINTMYRLNADTLFLYLHTNAQSEEFLFEIQHDDDSQSSLESGYYLMFENGFYKLDNNNKNHNLTLLENKTQVSELNKLIKRK